MLLINGRLWLAAVIVIALVLAFMTVASILTAKQRDRVALSVVDECRSVLSEALVKRLGSSESFSILLKENRKEAEDDVISCESEAMLIIKQEYDEKLVEESVTSLFELVLSPETVSSEMIRETVSGIVLSERARLKALDELRKEGYDNEKYNEYLEEFKAPRLYTVKNAEGSASDRAVFGRFFSGYAGFIALALMLIVLTAAKQLQDGSARLVSKRLSAIKHGRLIDRLSDILSLFITGGVISIAAFIFAPEKSGMLLVSLCAYSFFTAALGRVISRLYKGLRMDAATPVFVLATSILGGCFMDTGSLVPALNFISKLTPQGQFISSCGGNTIFTIILFIEGFVLYLINV